VVVTDGVVVVSVVVDVFVLVFVLVAFAEAVTVAVFFTVLVPAAWVTVAVVVVVVPAADAADAPAVQPIRAVTAHAPTSRATNLRAIAFTRTPFDRNREHGACRA